MTLKELALVFAETLDNELKVNFGALPYREREIMTPMSKGDILPGWSPSVSIHEGIRRTFSENK
jgi:nucleoside-diphosphate-sugar epimerase